MWSYLLFTNVLCLILYLSEGRSDRKFLIGLDFLFVVCAGVGPLLDLPVRRQRLDAGGAAQPCRHDLRGVMVLLSLETTRGSWATPCRNLGIVFLSILYFRPICQTHSHKGFSLPGSSISYLFDDEGIFGTVTSTFAVSWMPFSSSRFLQRTGRRLFMEPGKSSRPFRRRARVMAVWTSCCFG